MTADFVQIQGIYESIPTGKFVGDVEQMRTERVGEIRTLWCICVPNMDDRVMIVSRNGKNKTVIVENTYGWCYKILRNKVLASGGAKGLFNTLVRDLSNSDGQSVTASYMYNCLENIWKKTKSIYQE